MRDSITTNQIRNYRHQRKLRLRDVADLVGQTSVAHISHWEKGRKLPSLANALRLSAAIKCPVEVLFLELFNQLRNETHANQTRHRIKLTYE